MKTSIIIIGVIIVLLVSFSSYLVPSFGEYSTGERSGTIQKFSKKGFIAKTYEGELGMDGIKSTISARPGDSQVSSTFEFSVNDETIANQITEAVGQRVKVYYKENLHTNKFDGSTDYFIYKIEVIK